LKTPAYTPSRFRILQVNDPILREVCEHVSIVDDEVKQLVRRMQTANRYADGYGVAAPQIGENKRVIVWNVPSKALVNAHDNKIRKGSIIDPQVINLSPEQEVAEEGCLSIKGHYFRVARPKWITLAGLTVEGEITTFRATGLLARVILHEIDHLNGVLVVDRADEQDWLLYLESFPYHLGEPPPERIKLDASRARYKDNSTVNGIPSGRRF
jgi:peptide deformylase